MIRAKRWRLALGVLILAACTGKEAPIDEEPPGLLLVARTVDLGRMLERLASLEGTPLAREAERLIQGLPACSLIEGQAADGRFETLWQSLRCAPPKSPLSRLHKELGVGTVAFAWPLESGPQLRGRITFDHLDDAEIELSIPLELTQGAARLLVPGNEPPGPSVLSGTETLVHARLRPAAGLDLAALVPEGSQADGLFRLKSELFAGAVLDGTWEAAIYLPVDDSSMPRAALALGFRSRAPAVAALDGFVSELEQTWSIRREPFQTESGDGACLPELRILPEFAPCYVATRNALVVGWNPVSIAKALDGRVGPLGNVGGMLVELGRFREADARLARAAGTPPEVLALGPWGRLRVIGREEENGVRVRLHLEGRGGA